MRQSTRTFIAIPIPDAVSAELRRWQQALAPEVPGCRWVDPTLPLHITLAFLGDVPNRDLSPLCLAAAEAVERHGRLELNVRGIGCFPSPARPRVIWAGVAVDDPGPLASLRADVVRAAADAGYPPDDPRFHPHVTLGRIRSERGRPADGADLTELVARERDREAGGFSAVEVVTYSSSLEARGPVYAPLNRARLKGKKSQSSH